MFIQQKVEIFSRVTVYNFKTYDSTKEEWVTSSRMATEGYIRSIGGLIMLESETLIGAKDLEDTIRGFTKKGFVKVAA